MNKHFIFIDYQCETDSSDVTLNDEAEEYSEIMKNKVGKRYDHFADNVIAEVSPGKNARVLEIGPGPG